MAAKSIVFSVCVLLALVPYLTISDAFANGPTKSCPKGKMWCGKEEGLMVSQIIVLQIMFFFLNCSTKIQKQSDDTCIFALFFNLISRQLSSQNTELKKCVHSGNHHDVFSFSFSLFSL